MAENIYGGISYPNSSFHFDKIYKNFTAAQEGAKTDNILLGRYVLISYSDFPLSFEEKVSIVENEYKENEYYQNFIEDKQNFYASYVKEPLYLKDCDRVVCRKEYVESKFIYKPIANLQIISSNNNNNNTQSYWINF